MAINVIKDKCKGCGICVKACPFSAITMKDKVAVIGSACTACGVCVSKWTAAAAKTTRAAQARPKAQAPIFFLGVEWENL